MAERADPFAGDFDVGGFAPQKPKPRANPDTVRQVAAQTGFSSREPEKPKPEKQPRRERRVRRTGRTEKFFCTADPAVIDQFYAIADRQDWVLGETLERAVAALTREIGEGRGA